MSSKGLEENNYIVTTQQISEILSLSTRRIQQLANENALIKASRGKFDLPASITAYINYLDEKDKSDSKLNKNVEEALWTRVRRQKTELEVQIMKGELHRSEDVKRVMNSMLGGFRARLLSLPSKTAPQIMGKTEIPAIKEILKEAIYEAMNELSDYDPLVFYDYSNDKLFIEDGEEELEVESLSNDEELVHRVRKKKKD